MMMNSEQMAANFKLDLALGLVGLSCGLVNNNGHNREMEEISKPAHAGICINMFCYLCSAIYDVATLRLYNRPSFYLCLSVCMCVCVCVRAS